MNGEWSTGCSYRERPTGLRSTGDLNLPPPINPEPCKGDTMKTITLHRRLPMSGIPPVNYRITKLPNYRPPTLSLFFGDSS